MLRTLLFLLICACIYSTRCQTGVLAADFESSAPASLKVSADTKAGQPAIKATKNPLDASTAAEVTAHLAGAGAGWAGIVFPVSGVTSETDTITFDARAAGESGGLFITLTERDGSRWNANVKLEKEWQRFSVPAYYFSWFSGPASGEKTSPRFENVVSVNPWVGAMFQGANGFAIDNVRLADVVPLVSLRAVGDARVSLQTDATIEVEAVSGARKYTGELFVAIRNRKAALIPEKVPMRDGRAIIPIFAREPGVLELFLYEPYARTEQATSVTVERNGLYTQYQFEGFEGEQLLFANQAFAPTLKIEGTTRTPLTAHVEVRDHEGRVLVSQNESAAELFAGRGKLTIPTPGLAQLHIKLLAEPITQFPRSENRLPVSLHRAKDALNAVTADGITTDIVGGSLVYHDGLPTTATVLGEDRFPVFVATLSPFENNLYRSPFGISSGALFHLKDAEIPHTGAKRLRWHRKLGSTWARNDFWWHEIEPTSGTFSWFKADTILNTYRTNRLRLLAILNYASAWDKNAPATPEARLKWSQYVETFARDYGKRVAAFEVWNEPNSGFWAPAPNVDAYRELVKVSREAVRKHLPNHSIIAGALAGFDPVFLEGMFKDGYGQYFDCVSYHPYPDRLYQGPEDNYLDRTIDGMKAIMQKHGAGEKDLWITELGWPTKPGGVTELEQANYLTRAYAMALAKGVTHLFWYNLVDGSDLPWRAGWDAHLGLLDWNYSFKPSAVAYNLVEFMMAHMEPIGMRRQGNAIICSYNIMVQRYKWPGIMHVAWTNRPAQVEDVDLTMVSRGPMYAFDYLGAEKLGKLISMQNPPEADDHNTTGSIDDRTTAAATRQNVSPGEGVAPITYADVSDTSGFPRTEPLYTSAQDALTTRTYRFQVNHEPIYIWDSGIAPPKPKKHGH